MVQRKIENGRLTPIIIYEDADGILALKQSGCFPPRDEKIHIDIDHIRNIIMALEIYAQEYEKEEKYGT